MKQCSKCRKWKEESEFYKERWRKDGLSYWCKKCKREYKRSRDRIDRGLMKRYYSYEECHRIVDGVKERRCRRCEKWKAESEFYKDRWRKDMLSGWCKECSDKATNECRRRRLAVRN